MSTATIPCGQLATPALVARVASTMTTDGQAVPPYQLRPGFCRFCNHPLPYQFSATAWDEGQMKRVQWNEGDPIADKLQFNTAGSLELGNGTMLVHRKGARVVKTDEGLRPIGEMLPDILLAANGACDALTNEVFSAASHIARERANKVRQAQSIRTNAHQLAAQKQARAAAARMAGSLAENAEADEGGSY